MMKRGLQKKAFLSIFSSIVMLCLFASCTGAVETPKDELIPDELQRLESNLLFSEPYPDSDTLAEDIFVPALSLYCSFKGLGHPETEWGNEADSFSEEIDGFTVYYNRVIDERYPTYQSFVDELSKHFSSEIVEELLSGGDYIEKDGKFYSSAGDRGRHLYFRDVKYEIDSQAAEKIIFKAIARYYKDEDFFNKPAPQTEEEWARVEFETKEIFYTYEKINDRWVFTTFELFY